MATINLKETDLIGEVLKRFPHAEGIFRHHFGEKFLARESVKILSLSLAGILRGVSLIRLMDELQDFQRERKYIFNDYFGSQW